VPFTKSAAVTTVACTLLAVAPAARAERADRDQPTQIEADAMRYEDQKQLSTFTGHVVLNKGSIVMRGAQLQVQQDAAGNQHGTLRPEPGQRAFFRQKREGLNEFIEAEGEAIDYDGKTDTVRITGRAEMRRLAGTVPQDQVKGSVIVYDNVKEVYTVDGKGANERVKAVLAPRSPASAAASTSAPLRSTSELRR
jgi:lipopolysaccharide export system protein LptA